MKPRILFVTEKWPANNPEFGLTNAYHYLFDTLALTTFAEHIRILHFDEWFLHYGEKADCELLTVVAEEKINIIVYSWLTSPTGPPEYFGPFNPELQTFNRARRINPNLKTCAIWWDSVWNVSQQVVRFLYPFVDLNLTIDYTFDSPPDRILAMWTPQNPEYYYGDPKFNRPVDVAHAGRLDNRPERKLALDALQMRGVYVSHAGGQKEDKLAIAEYAGIFRTCKIMLDFTTHQHKGRAWETTLSGAMLIAAETCQLNKWFLPNVDYVTYKMKGDDPDFDDLAQKIKFYLANEEERLKIATSGHKRATEEYNYREWWKKVLGKLGWQPEEGQKEDVS